MIGVKHIKELIIRSFEPTDQNYLLVQSYFEGYLKRLLFIVLRKNGLQYKFSQELISYAPYSLKLTEQLDLAFTELCVTSYVDIKNLDKKLERLEKCLIYYVRPIRNTLAHGADHNLNVELLNLCIKITQEYVRTIEYHLNQLGGYSAFDKPSKWGAKRVNKNIGLPNHLSKTFGFKNVKKFNMDKIVKELSLDGIIL